MDDLNAYENLDFSLFKKNFLKLLNLEESSVAQMRYTIDQNLTSELWSFSSHSTDIVVKSKLRLAISVKEKHGFNRPLLPNIFIEFSDMEKSNKFIVEIDFKHFCQIRKYGFSGSGNLYYECINSGFAIWLNTIKERLFYLGISSPRILVDGKNYEVEHGFNSLI